MRLHAFVCGWLEADLRLFLTDEPGRLRVPVPSFLIEHPRGTVVFDSGLHADLQDDPHARLGRIADLYRVDFEPGQGQEPLLFNVVEDVGSTTNLADQHPDIVERLSTIADEARRDLGDRGAPGRNMRPRGHVDNPQPQRLR